jgi:hypothetical protein
MTEYISEIFNRIDKAKNRKKKKEILESCKDNKIFKFVLQGTFDPSIEWTIKVPKYTAVVDRPLELVEMSLFATVPKCSIFVKGHARSKPLGEQQSEDLLVQMLEVMHQDESKIFAGMLRKKLKVKGLTLKLVLEVFPNLYQKV